MTGAPLGAFVAAVAALLAIAAGVAFARARTPGDTITAFAAAGFFGAVTAGGAGAGVAGAAILAATAVLAIVSHATASRARATASATRRPPNRTLYVSGAVAVLVCVASWGTAPAAQTARPPTPDDADLLFAAMALMLVVAGVAAAILGRGERGVLGPDSGGTP